MSAQSVLAGLMPPLENNNVLPIPWQPVAINTLARNDDIVSFLSINRSIATQFTQLSNSSWPKRSPATNTTTYCKSYTKIPRRNYSNWTRRTRDSSSYLARTPARYIYIKINDLQQILINSSTFRTFPLYWMLNCCILHSKLRKRLVWSFPIGRKIFIQRRWDLWRSVATLYLPKHISWNALKAERS